jgi:hypothetical protein
LPTVIAALTLHVHGDLPGVVFERYDANEMPKGFATKRTWKGINPVGFGLHSRILTGRRNLFNFFAHV